MKKMALSSVYLQGLSGTGIEIAKNLVLGGIKKLSIDDPVEVALPDLDAQFYLRPEHLAAPQSRCDASIAQLQKLNPYVTIHKSDVKLREIQSDDYAANEAFWRYLKEFQCIVLTSCNLRQIALIDVFCIKNDIRLIVCEVLGVFGMIFCNFGRSFVARDPTGEEAKEFFIGRFDCIKKKCDSEVEITALNESLHDLESSDFVRIEEVPQLPTLNNKEFAIRVLSPSKIALIGAQLDVEFANCGGRCVQCKRPQTFQFRAFLDQLHSPDLLFPDLGKLSHPIALHIVYLAIKKCQSANQSAVLSFDERVQRIMAELERIRPEFADLLPLPPPPPPSLSPSLSNPESSSESDGEQQPDQCVPMRKLVAVSDVEFPPLCAFFGGVAAQEVMKALTGKFSPIKQWLYLDCAEVLPPLSEICALSRSILTVPPPSSSACVMTSSHAFPSGILRCVGVDLARTLVQLNVFMVGCGAIGCELLKNFAMLRVASDTRVLIGQPATGNDAIKQSEAQQKHQHTKMGGTLHITDDDLIEKSNLNRQFLFHHEHIQLSKSAVAAQSIAAMRRSTNLVAHKLRVNSESERGAFSDAFISGQQVCVNALDNVETRRYMDARCVTNGVALLESGTQGGKGHVQVIVPHLTETYASQHDPPDLAVPYCTLKSFPANIAHCIEWARDKFDTQFSARPQMIAQFMAECACVCAAAESGNHQLEAVAASLEASDADENTNTQAVPLTKTLRQNAVKFGKFVEALPASWPECVQFARVKFQKMFPNMATALLDKFPLDTKLEDGTLFWQLPKRAPIVIEFDATNQRHVEFIETYAALLAEICGLIDTPPRGLSDASNNTANRIRSILSDFKMPELKITQKEIVTDESVTKNALESVDGGEEGDCNDGFSLAAQSIRKFLAAHPSDWPDVIKRITNLEFEKDDDMNRHIDFIASIANLRAEMYGIERAERHVVKKIAGKIVPAIATTTAAVSGLVTIELVKLFKRGDSAPHSHSPAHSQIHTNTHRKLELFRNCFLNLGLSMFMLSEPGPCKTYALRRKTTPTLPSSMNASRQEKEEESCSTRLTLWDKLEVRESGDKFTLADFAGELERQLLDVRVSIVMHGNRMIYTQAWPGQDRKLKQKMISLIKLEESDKTHSDLMVMYKPTGSSVETKLLKTKPGNEEYIDGPPVRFYLRESKTA